MKVPYLCIAFFCFLGSSAIYASHTQGASSSSGGGGGGGDSFIFTFSFLHWLYNLEW
jgi:hypothetical protein